MIQTTIYDFLEGGNPSFSLIQSLKEELTKTENKISPSFVESVVAISTIKYHHLTPTMRACTITLPTGHEVIGIAQVLDAKNDNEDIGNAVALTRAKNELWPLLGSIAKVLI